MRVVPRGERAATYAMSYLPSLAPVSPRGPCARLVPDFWRRAARQNSKRFRLPTRTEVHAVTLSATPPGRRTGGPLATSHAFPRALGTMSTPSKGRLTSGRPNAPSEERPDAVQSPHRSRVGGDDCGRRRGGAALVLPAGAAEADVPRGGGGSTFGRSRPGKIVIDPVRAHVLSRVGVRRHRHPAGSSVFAS